MAVVDEVMELLRVDWKRVTVRALKNEAAHICEEAMDQTPVFCAGIPRQVSEELMGSGQLHCAWEGEGGWLD
jgi:hypothetical protein